MPKDSDPILARAPKMRVDAILEQSVGIVQNWAECKQKIASIIEKLEFFDASKEPALSLSAALCSDAKNEGYSPIECVRSFEQAVHDVRKAKKFRSGGVKNGHAFLRRCAKSARTEMRKECAA
jgi:hypothetical protein